MTNEKNGQNDQSVQNSEIKQMIRIYSHEISQILIGMRNISTFSLNNSERIKAFSDDKINDILSDLNGSIELLRILNNNMRTVANGMEVDNPFEVEDVYIFKDIIFKLRNIYSHTIQDKHLAILTPVVTYSDEERSPYKTNKRYLEQIITNLLNNAIKFAYWRTNIFIDAIRPFKDSNSRSITITNYGPPIDSSDNPYELYFRGKKTHDTEGTGIGLYVSNNLAKLLNGNIQYTSRWVSDFYIPYIEVYLSRPLESNKENHILDNRLQEELTRLKSSNIYSNVVSQRFSYVDENELFMQLPEKLILDKIHQPTYKTTFEVSI